MVSRNSALVSAEVFEKDENAAAEASIAPVVSSAVAILNSPFKVSPLSAEYVLNVLLILFQFW
jgi:hypothetical protein